MSDVSSPALRLWTSLGLWRCCTRSAPPLALAHLSPSVRRTPRVRRTRRPEGRASSSAVDAHLARHALSKASSSWSNSSLGNGWAAFTARLPAATLSGRASIFVGWATQDQTTTRSPTSPSRTLRRPPVRLAGASAEPAASPTAPSRGKRLAALDRRASHQACMLMVI